jgi:hypothetical protein
VELEDELEVMTLNDQNGPVGSARTLYGKSAEMLRASSRSTDPRDKEQWNKVFEIRGN